MKGLLLQLGFMQRRASLGETALHFNNNRLNHIKGVMLTASKVLEAVAQSQLPPSLRDLFAPGLTLVTELLSKVGGPSKLGSFGSNLLNSTLAHISLFMELYHPAERVSHILFLRLLSLVSVILQKAPKTTAFKDILSHLGYAAFA